MRMTGRWARTGAAWATLSARVVWNARPGAIQFAAIDATPFERVVATWWPPPGAAPVRLGCVHVVRSLDRQRHGRLVGKSSTGTGDAHGERAAGGRERGPDRQDGTAGRADRVDGEARGRPGRQAGHRERDRAGEAA